MKSKLSAILVICMLFMFSGCFNVYAEDLEASEITEAGESAVIEEKPIIPAVPDMPASSVDTVAPPDNNDSSLTIECRDNETILADMNWKVYKVADIEDGSYVLTNEFEGYNVNLNNLATSEFAAVAEALEAYASVDAIFPLIDGSTDSNGILELTELSYGLYLLSGEPITVGDNYYLPTPSLVTLDGREGQPTKWTYSVTTLPKMAVLGVNDRIFHYAISVKKVWENDNKETRPESITAILVRDGSEYARTILSEANNWTYTWDHLSSKYNWTVIEEDIPNGYTASYMENHINIRPNNPKEFDVEYVIVNTRIPVVTTPAPPPVAIAQVTKVTTTVTTVTTVTTTTTVTKKLVEKPAVEKPPVEQSKALPQTGQLWWPVPAFSAAGLLMFTVGWKFNSNKRRYNEK